MKKVRFVIAYLMCSWGAWGISTGAICCYSPDTNSSYMAGITAAAGPAGLAIATMFQGMYDLTEGRGFHFRMRPLSYEQRWQAFHRLYPSLSHYYFDHGHDEVDEHCKCDDGK